MEFLIEFIGEFLFEILFETGSDKKISKWIRYPILVILITFYIAIVIGLAAISISLAKENILMSIFFIIVDIIVILGVMKLLKKGKENSLNKNN